MSYIALDDATPANIGVIKKINDVCLPIKYERKWYVNSLKPNKGNMVKYAYFKELPVGAIKARVIENVGLSSTPPFVYIDSIAVLDAYRGLGIGKKLLDWLVEETKNIYLHKVTCHGVKSSVDWYLKQGFKDEGILKCYYAGHDEPDAVILVMDF